MIVPNRFDDININKLRHFIFDNNLATTLSLQPILIKIRPFPRFAAFSSIYSSYHLTNSHKNEPTTGLYSLQRSDINNALNHVESTCFFYPASLENIQVSWLIHTFNTLFYHKNTVLVRGGAEPEYFPATKNDPARIKFAHGFLSSALHEISHWTIAGSYRRTLPDFGYWYASDGRTESQQHAFERVEIKPQAIECLLSHMMGKNFNTSKDNLNADFDVSNSTFDDDVLNQVNHYIETPQTLPTDARILLTTLAQLCHD